MPQTFITERIVRWSRPGTLLGGTPFFLVVLCLTISGCGHPPQKAETPPPPEVQVSEPVADTVLDYEKFTGRTEAVKSILVRARVQGYLEVVKFTEGAEVKEGAPLFIIDQRTYQADYDRAKANLNQAKAHLTRTTADFKRALELLPEKAISESDYDLARGDRDEAAAAVEVAEAALHTAKLNLDFTTVTAPISGRISRQLADPGNLILADNTVLTTLVSLEPMYAYFDVDERTMLRIRRLVRAGKVKSAQQSEVKVYLGLSDEEGYPHEGTINFIDNQVDAMTGTLRLRGVFPNQKRILSPGMFARIKVPIGDPHRAILVSERALGSDQGQKFLYVVNAKNEIVYRPVQVGLLNNGLRVIDSGLSAGERVVLSGLQRVRPGITVQPKEVKMTADEILATPAATAVGAPAPAAKPKAGATGVASAAADLPTKTGTAANAASRSRPSP